MLDLFFKKYAWTVNAALVAAAAWFGAKTVNAFAGSAIRPVPAIDLSARPSPTARPEAAHLEPDRLYALFGIEPPKVAPTEEAHDPAAAAANTCVDYHAAPMKSGLRAQLVAAAVADRPQYSIASITDLGTRETRVYAVGDALLGATILSVESIRDDRDPERPATKPVVIVCNNGTKEFVDFEPGDGTAPSAMNLGTHPVLAHGVGAAPPGDEDRAEGRPADGIRKISDNRYDIKRQVIDSTLTNLNQIATQARIVPSFKNGVSNGFKLFSIQPGSLYAGIGVENGDVIQRINGYEINSPDRALEVYQKLKESSHITVEIDRNGQVLRKEYSITP